MLYEVPVLSARSDVGNVIPELFTFVISNAVALSVPVQRISTTSSLLFESTFDLAPRISIAGCL